MSNRRNTTVITLTDGTNTMNGATGCLPKNTTFTSRWEDVSDWEHFTLYLKCNDVTTSMACEYHTSPDGSEDFNGQVSISNLDNNEQVIDLTEDAVKYFRLEIINAMAAEAANVLAMLVCKS